MKTITILVTVKISEMKKGLNFSKESKVVLLDENKLDEVFEHLQECLEASQFDLSKFDGNGIRVIIMENDDYFDEKSLSVNFRLNDIGSLGVFHCWACDKNKAFPEFVWRIWSFLHEQLEPLKIGA